MFFGGREFAMADYSDLITSLGRIWSRSGFNPGAIRQEERYLPI